MVIYHKAGFILSLVFMLLTVSTAAGTVVLPQTGQTTCWDEDGVELTSCDGTGQDGDILAGANWPTPRFKDNGDGTMADNLTGLMWLKDANCIATHYASFDTDGTNGDGEVTWGHALDFVAGINDGTYAACGGGRTNWRLPNVNELESLLYLETDNTSGWLETSGFINVTGGSGFYWSSTTYKNSTTEAWTVFIEGEFNNSFVKNTDKHRAWPVRDSVPFSPAPVWRTGQTSSYASGDDGEIQAGAAWPAPRFEDNGDGTVSDDLTGLMWLKDANCMATYYASFDTDGINGDGKVTWQHALDFVAGINGGTHFECSIGYPDWRLANWKELHSLTDFSQYQPALPTSHPFTNLPAFSPEYWSSTTSLGAGGGDLAWVLDLESGLMADYFKKLSNLYVWPVRAGTLPPDITVTDSIPSVVDLQIPFSKVPTGNYSDQTLTITNEGSSDLVVGDIAQVDALSIPFEVVNDNCSGQTLAKSANCTTGIRYSPTSTDLITDTLDIPSNDPNENPVIVEVSGGYYLELAQTGQDTSQATGDDGDVQAGITWPSPRFTDNGDGTVNDDLTGLMWLKDANCFGYQSWENSLTAVANFNSTPAMYDCASYDESSPPHSDWRLPNVNEIESLTNAGYDGNNCGASSCSSNAEWLNSQNLVNVQVNSYWSSTTDTLFKGEARSVDMTDGSVYRIDKSSDSILWPVRAGQMGNPDSGYPANTWQTGQTNCYDALGGSISCSNTGQDGDIQAGVSWLSPRFSDNGDGTVRDTLTGLIWLQDANCMVTQYAGFDSDETPGDGRVTWLHGLDFVLGINSGTYSNCGAGLTNWHLPNRKELLSLHDYAQDSPILPLGHPFTNVNFDFYWSSTTKAGSTNIAWRDSLEEGFILGDFKTANNYVWPVHSAIEVSSTPSGLKIYLPLINRD